MDQLLAALPIISIVVAGIALYLANRALQGERRVKLAYSRFTRGNKHDVLTLIDMHVREVEALRREVAYQQKVNQQLMDLQAISLSQVGVVRYDAFDDMGGRLSFSAALLNEAGDGTVITAMNGRMQTRTYAKQISKGQSTHNLSKEEQSAIAKAMKQGKATKDRIAAGMGVLPGISGVQPKSAQARLEQAKQEQQENQAGFEMEPDDLDLGTTHFEPLPTQDDE